MSEAATKTKPDMSDIIKLTIVVYPPGTTIPTSMTSAATVSLSSTPTTMTWSAHTSPCWKRPKPVRPSHDLQWPKKPRTAALRAETKAAWDEWEAQRAESGKPLTDERGRPWTVSEPTTLFGNCTQ
jgi:hypothetical protein